jgi:hypothetical protein
MTDGPSLTVFLDANVLAKPVTRTLLMVASVASGYGVTWSEYVENEANRHVRSNQLSATGVRIAAGSELSPAGETSADFTRTAAKDRQVLADAIAAEAVVIVTEDVDDFGEDDLKSVGVAAVNPDLFLSVRATSEGYLEALRFISKRAKSSRITPEELHVRLGRAHPLTTQAKGPLFTQAPEPATHNPPAHIYRGNRCLRCLQTKDAITDGICAECARQR